MTDLAAFCPAAQTALRLARPVLRTAVTTECPYYFEDWTAAEMLSEVMKNAAAQDWLDVWANALDALFATEAALGQISPEQDVFTETLDAWRADWLARRDTLLAEARAFAPTPKTETPT